MTTRITPEERAADEAAVLRAFALWEQSGAARDAREVTGDEGMHPVQVYGFAPEKPEGFTVKRTRNALARMVRQGKVRKAQPGRFELVPDGS